MNELVEKKKPDFKNSGARIPADWIDVVAEISSRIFNHDRSQQFVYTAAVELLLRLPFDEIAELARGVRNETEKPGGFEALNARAKMLREIAETPPVKAAAKIRKAAKAGRGQGRRPAEPGHRSAQG